MSKRLEIQIWSDVACPWCYLGKRRLDAALAKFEHSDAVRIHWRAFELDRSAPAVYPPSPTYTERLAGKYRMPVEHAARMIDEMTARGAKEAVEFDFSKVRGVNTFAAHQLSVQAGHSGDPELQHRLAERLFRGYFTEGRVMSDPETLIELATDVGMPSPAVRAALDTETYATEARAEEAEAATMGVTGVPFFTIGRYAVEGAQSSELLLRVLEQAWSEVGNEDEPSLEEGAVCGPEGC